MVCRVTNPFEKSVFSECLDVRCSTCVLDVLQFEGRNNLKKTGLQENQFARKTVTS